MHTFRCLACGQPAHFDDSVCTRCGATLGFLPGELRLASMEPCEDGTWRATSPRPWSYRPGFLERLFGAKPRVVEVEDSGVRYRRCANGTQHNVCNWMVDADSDERWCPACRTNRTIPNLARPGNVELWSRLERAKRRALYGPLGLGLPIRDRVADPEQGLAFDFLSGQDGAPGQSVLTGHCNGLVTVAIDDLDAEGLGAPVATRRNLVGLFRHLLGYYYWDRLVRDGGALDEFRALFGDERLDYGVAQQEHSRNGAPADWQDRYVSASASSHPWEDWAETWVLYLRMEDVLETAGRLVDAGDLGPASASSSGVAYQRRQAPGDFQTLMDHWLPTAVALNDLNRNLGQPDIHPDRLSPLAIDKLAFVHRMVRAASADR